MYTVTYIYIYMNVYMHICLQTGFHGWTRDEVARNWRGWRETRPLGSRYVHFDAALQGGLAELFTNLWLST